jgi:hypothetical protein
MPLLLVLLIYQNKAEHSSSLPLEALTIPLHLEALKGLPITPTIKPADNLVEEGLVDCNYYHFF